MKSLLEKEENIEFYTVKIQRKLKSYITIWQKLNSLCFIALFRRCIPDLAQHLHPCSGVYSQWPWASTHTETPTHAHLRLFVVTLGDLIVGDVDETHFSLLLLELTVKDLKTEQISLPLRPQPYNPSNYFYSASRLPKCLTQRLIRLTVKNCRCLFH